MPFDTKSTNLLYRVACLEAKLESVGKRFTDITKYNPAHVSSGDKGGQFTSNKGGGGSLVAGKYKSGSAMGYAYSMLDDGETRDLITTLAVLKNVKGVADPMGRLNWLKKHGEENGQWDVIINKKAGTVQMVPGSGVPKESSPLPMTPKAKAVITQAASLYYKPPSGNPKTTSSTPTAQTEFKDYSSHINQLDNFKKSAGDKLRRQLTNDEESAITSYTFSSSKLNGGLRQLGGVSQVSTLDNHAVTHLTTGIRKGSMPENVVVYRGTRDLEVSPGQIFIDHGFMSTSLTSSTATKFHKGVLLKINVRQGHNAAVLGNLSALPSESEVIFPRGSLFKVLSVEPKGAYKVIHVDAI